jgi:hypothetical protein
MKPVTFQIIRQLYAKTGQIKNRTPLLSESSVFIVRSVAYGFGQFSLFLFTPNHNLHKKLQTFSTQVEVRNPNQKQILYANCTPN